MKRAISLFVSALLLVSMFFAFGSPAQATDIPLHIVSPYLEYLAYADDGYFDLTFTVERSGYYIIQTFGCYDYAYDEISSYIDVVIYDSSNDVVGEYNDGAGFYGGLFIFEYFEENETYTVYMSFDEDVSRFRLSITNAAAYFSSWPREYRDIVTIHVDYDGSEPQWFPFENNDQLAVVILLEYDVEPGLPVRNYVCNATCCSCTEYRLVVPYGHGLQSYGGSQVIYNVSPTSQGAPLYDGVTYYLVLYRGTGNGGCPDHDAYYDLEIVIEPADWQ